MGYRVRRGSRQLLNFGEKHGPGGPHLPGHFDSTRVVSTTAARAVRGDLERMITIGLRASPTEVTFAIYDAAERRVVNVEELVV